ncbi:MAG: TonB-dependent receptor [Bacteroides sp.]|nr:TonB-dependent receptor [Bacteroides sp.]
MMKRMKVYAFLGALVFPSYLLAAVTVPDSTSRKSVMLDEVVVTSYKEKKTLREVPASVSLISLGDLNKKNLVDFKELSSYIPNLFLPDYGSKLTSPIYIRGIGSKLTPSVGLYVDGIPFFDKSVFDFDMNEVNRVEVLRGPQGTLYGRNTMGGIINVYTKNPLDYQGLTYKQMVGNYGQTQFSGSYYGKLSDRVGYAVSSRYKHNDGFFVNAYTGSEADNLNQISSKGKIQWKTESGWDGVFSVNYEYTDQGGYPYGLLDNTTGQIGDVNYNAYSSYRQGVLTSGLSMSYSFDDFVLKSVTGYQNLDDRQAIDQDFTAEAKAFVIQTQKQNQFSQELEMRSKEGKRFTWLNGIFGFYQTGKRMVLYTTQKDYDEPSYGLAAYHQSTLKDFLLKKLSLTVGARFDYEKAKQDYIVWKLSADQKEQTTRLNDSESFTQFTPKVSLQYQFDASNMIYATTTRGYKTGGFNISFSTEDERTYSPEYSWNYEVGGRFSAFNNRLYGDLALFYIDWRNQQISHAVANKTGSMLTNAGKSYSKGVELSLNARPADLLNLQFTYGYTEAKFREYLYGDADYSGNYIPYVPQQTLMLGGDYTWNLSARYVDRLIFSAQYTATGRHYWNDSNDVRQGFYGILNGKLSAVKRNLTVDLWIKNAASKEYMAYFFQTSGKYFAQKGKPLTFGTTISFTL